MHKFAHKDPLFVLLSCSVMTLLSSSVSNVDSSTNKYEFNRPVPINRTALLCPYDAQLKHCRSDDSCVDFDRHCPPCGEFQYECEDGACIDYLKGKVCAFCLLGERRCASGHCIPASARCLEPCYDDEFVCEDRSCVESVELCQCDYGDVLCADGSCAVSSYSCIYNAAQVGSGEIPSVVLYAPVLVIMAIAFCLVYCLTRKKCRVCCAKKPRVLSALEQDAMIGEASSRRSGEGVFQNVPSHFPVPHRVKPPPAIVGPWASGSTQDEHLSLKQPVRPHHKTASST